MKASRRMMNMAKVQLRNYVPSRDSVTINFVEINGNKKRKISSHEDNQEESSKTEQQPLPQADDESAPIPN